MAVSGLRWHLGAGKQKDIGSELRQPPLINSLLKRVCSIEKDLIMNGILFPVGGSLLCAGVKG